MRVVHIHLISSCFIGITFSRPLWCVFYLLREYLWLFSGVSLEDGFRPIAILHETSLVIICHHESKNRTLSVKSPSCRALPVLAQGLSDPSAGPQLGFLAFRLSVQHHHQALPPSPLLTLTPSYSRKGTPPKEMGWFYSLPSELNSWKIIQKLAQTVKNLPAMQETHVQSLGQEYPLAKGEATQSSILAWRIPWREEPGRL